MREPSLRRTLLFLAAWCGFYLFLMRPSSPGPETGLFPLRPVAVAAALTLMAVGLYGVLYYGRRAWRLADTPIARIRSTPQGYVELYGRAGLLPGPPILAPLSDLPCAWYRYRIEERSEKGGWRTVDAGESDSLFLLDDGTGRCVIDPEGADILKARRDVWYTSPDGARIFSAFGIGTFYRYTEQRLLPGEELHAIGLFRTVGGLSEAPDTRREVTELLERWKRDPRRMALFDRNHDGRIDPEEWEVARRVAHRQVEREQLQRAVEPEVHLLANPGDPNRPFLIAAFKEENRLIHYFYRRAALCLLATALVGGFLLWLLS